MHRTQPLSKGLKDVYLFEIETIKESTMDYLFLHRDKRTFTSERQRNLLFRAARLYWEQKYADSEVVRKGKSIVSYINMYCIIWKCAKCFLTRSFH